VKKLLFTGVAFTALIGGSAMAADLARPVYRHPVAVAAPVYSWTGFYVGGNVGYAWGHSDITPNFYCTDPAQAGCSVNVPANLANINAASIGSLSNNRFTGGGQVGYNWQIGGLVLGVESDFNAFRLSNSQSAAVPSTTTASIFNPSTSLETDWLFTLRGRAGWAVAPAVLLYATGGLAITRATLANLYFTTNNPANLGAGASSNAETLTGWTVGGGVEWALNHNWTLKGEYLYADFGSLSTTAYITGPGFAFPNVFSTSADLKAQIVRVGLNYKFGYAAAPAVYR
jgi:outer membrane immunogenic protein